MKKEEIIKILENVKDPEIPVLSIIDMGIVRKIKTNNYSLEINITPTYSGCPAMKVIEEDIIKVLKTKIKIKVKVKHTISPAWTTDWLTEKGKFKLEKYGIAPPLNKTIDKGNIMGLKNTIKCPQCKSKSTELISQFSSTACKALYKCNNCLEPFEYFKCI